MTTEPSIANKEFDQHILEDLWEYVDEISEQIEELSEDIKALRKAEQRRRDYENSVSGLMSGLAVVLGIFLILHP